MAWARGVAWTARRVSDPKVGGSNPPGPVKISIDLLILDYFVAIRIDLTPNILGIYLVTRAMWWILAVVPK